VGFFRTIVVSPSSANKTAADTFLLDPINSGRGLTTLGPNGVDACLLLLLGPPRKVLLIAEAPVPPPKDRGPVPGIYKDIEIFSGIKRRVALFLVFPSGFGLYETAEGICGVANYTADKHGSKIRLGGIVGAVTQAGKQGNAVHVL
jgi:hypothetical protein